MRGGCRQLAGQRNEGNWRAPAGVAELFCSLAVVFSLVGTPCGHTEGSTGPAEHHYYLFHAIRC